MGLRVTYIKVIIGCLTVVFLGSLLLVIIANVLITSSTKKYIYSDLQLIPYNKVGLLLGTSKYSRTGGTNDHYKLRLQAAYNLFKGKRIDYILISGDNRTPYYNEPSTIRHDLLKMGIPKQRIYRDYAGFRTLDSIIRAHKVFGLNKLTIISQGYLNNRALYIALNQHIDAIAFSAGTGAHSDLSNQGREIMARVLALLELHVFHTQPHYLGPAIKIGTTPPT